MLSLCILNGFLIVVYSADQTSKLSNELEVMLPLNTESIRLPVPAARADDEELYKEFIEIRENAGDSE